MIVGRQSEWTKSNIEVLVKSNYWLELRFVDSLFWPNHAQSLVFFFVFRDGLLNRCVMLLVA